MSIRFPSLQFISTHASSSKVLAGMFTGSVQSNANNQIFPGRIRRAVYTRPFLKYLRTSCSVSVPGPTLEKKGNSSSDFLRDKTMVPDADPPSTKDINLLYQFFDRSTKLVVLTGAGISTESGIPDYRSPNGAYSTGFKPITHQVVFGRRIDIPPLPLNFLPTVLCPTDYYTYIGVLCPSARATAMHPAVDGDAPDRMPILCYNLKQEFVRSSRARRRYWARSYAGWRRFTKAQPSAAHLALAALERASKISFMITQNVERLHHRAGSSPLELHGTVYTVGCLDCGFSFPRQLFQDQVKTLNPKWAEAIESLDYDSRSDNSFGMKQRPDGDIEIDEKFWEEAFNIPTCSKCNGILKPDVVFFGDNVPKDKADAAMEAAKGCDAFLVLGSSVMTMSAFRLVRAAREAGAAIGIVNLGVTRADGIVDLKINARLGEILPRLLDTGSLSIPASAL